MAAVSGSGPSPIIRSHIAKAYYGIPAEFRNGALFFLDQPRRSVVTVFEQKYGMTAKQQAILCPQHRPVLHARRPGFYFFTGYFYFAF